MKLGNSNYDHTPYIDVIGYENDAYRGYEAITKVLGDTAVNGVLTIDCYPGVRIHEIVEGLKKYLSISHVFYAEDTALSGEEITQCVKRNLTDDRVFGVLSHYKLDEFFVQEKIVAMREQIESANGTILLIGVGASLICRGDVLVYADLARWEIQQRYRSKELSNWKMDNYDEDTLRKYKRGFFFEWRISDRHKRCLFEDIDYLLDTNLSNDPKMISGSGFLEGLKQAANRPFRLVPFFDPGVWGGQWMKEKLGLDPKEKNYAWCFDCVPEENSLYLKFNDICVEIPSINLVFRHPIELLGDKVHARFGAEFPIRFDFLDTIEGQNLSLQVHPLTEYIQENFGMHYTQDESYYILEAQDKSHVYLGVKNDVDPEKMVHDLEAAERGEKSFEAERFVNKLPAKKHDHFLIPAGTIHCSGAGTMVLEISATPYIFTFKIWDWDRLGLDGLPRPVHINHGKHVIQYTRNTEWVKRNLVNRIEKVNEGDGWIEERTGLHEREFIETRRHWFSKPVIHNTKGSVNVLNLIEGEEAIVESPTNAFKPFVIHYAETFIIPEAVREYSIRPYGISEGKTVGTIKAYVRV